MHIHEAILIACKYTFFIVIIWSNCGCQYSVMKSLSSSVIRVFLWVKEFMSYNHQPLEEEEEY